ncbi:MAG: D-glycero-beta-D-manno-heptose 1,7-bisphosphate 7-phosphatase [Psychrilyobacter sp.]|uniref:D-glycero-beta-D-manno-heptose 1,7-bisphosphate 7-phosphatase n=1 Tax=Psychrilyobacter sp. TaxID=2586924 RepID=UPI003C7538FA
MKKCVFLDRDGNINVEKDYLHKVEEFEFIDGAKKAIKIFNDLDYLVVIVTNQSGVARGYYDENSVKILHDYLQREVEKIGGHIDGFYYCPHHPEKGIGQYKLNCNCRKPEPGMFLQAQKDLGIDFSSSIMVGDKISDVNAGKNLGMRSILVKTGHGLEEEKKSKGLFEVHETLYEFAKKLKEEVKI